MRLNMSIALRERTLSPVRLVLEDSLKRSFMLFVDVSFQLGSIIRSNPIQSNPTDKMINPARQGRLFTQLSLVIGIPALYATWFQARNNKAQ